MKPIASISSRSHRWDTPTTGYRFLNMTEDTEFPTQRGVNEYEEWRNKQQTAREKID